MMPKARVNSRGLTRAIPWLALLLVAQGAMFVTRYEATIASTIPWGQAQSALLEQIYTLSDSGQTLGLLDSWRAGIETLDRLTVATVLGSLLDLYAGGGRLALLLPNLALLLALEVSIIAATLRLTHRSSLAAVGLGLFLLQSRPWSSETGLLSVNPDWIAYCAFGVVAAAMIAPPRGGRRGLVILCALFGSITLCFSLPAFACLLVVVALRVIVGDGTDRLRVAPFALSAFLAVAAIVMLSVAPRCPPTPATVVRLDQGAVSACGYGLRTSLQYLLSFEFGLKFVATAALGLAGTAAAFALARRTPGAPPKHRPVRREAMFLIALLFAFALIQLVWRSANPIASGFIDIPALMLIITSFDLFGDQTDSTMHRPATAAALLFLAVCAVLQWCSPISDLPTPIASIPAVRSDVISWLMRDAEEDERPNATILLAPQTIDVDAQGLSALFYETFGEIAGFTVDAISDRKSAGAEAEAGTATYDYAVFPDKSDLERSVATSTDASLFQRIQGSMVERAHFHSPGRDLDIYSVPKIKLAGVSGGWLLSEGTSLRFDKTEIPNDSVIALRGPDGYARYLPDVPAVTAVADTREGPIALPAHFERQGDFYAISVDPSPLATVQTARTDVHLTFSRYFVPNQIGMNADPRKLTVLAPTSVGIAPRVTPPSQAR